MTWVRAPASAYFLKMVKIGIIGGSGLDDPDILRNKQEKEVNTLYGKPSSNLILGKINDVDAVILARHGRKHTIPPTKVNYKANVFALKQEGCTHIIATTAVGSLKEEIERGDLVIIDQFIDFTRHREITYHDSFENGPKHTPMAEPFDKFLRIDKFFEIMFLKMSKVKPLKGSGPKSLKKGIVFKSFVFNTFSHPNCRISL